MAVTFESRLIAVTKATDEALAKAAEIIGGMLETKAKQYITEGVYTNDSHGWYIRTGNLRNSITHKVEQEENATTAIVGSAVEYAPYVELGTGIYADMGGRQTPWKYQDKNGNWHTTRGMPARPYLRPALENHIKDYQDVLAEVLKDIS